jgi:hypothetical protein
MQVMFSAGDLDITNGLFHLVFELGRLKRPVKASCVSDRKLLGVRA